MIRHRTLRNTATATFTLHFSSPPFMRKKCALCRWRTVGEDSFSKVIRLALHPNARASTYHYRKNSRDTEGRRNTRQGENRKGPRAGDRMLKRKRKIGTSICTHGMGSSLDVRAICMERKRSLRVSAEFNIFCRVSRYRRGNNDVVKWRFIGRKQIIFLVFD